MRGAASGAVMTEALFYELGGVPSVRIAEILNERGGYTLSAEATAAEKEARYELLLPRCRPVERVVALVRAYCGVYPLAVASGLAMLRYLKAHREVYQQIDRAAARITEAAPEGVTVNRVGSMFTFFFGTGPVTSWDSAKTADTTRFNAFFHHMLENGVYLPPSQFEAGFVSAAHDEEAVDATVQAIRSFR